MTRPQTHCLHHQRAIRSWDPAGDLADDTALHIDGCADCRGAFDARFAPAIAAPSLSEPGLDAPSSPDDPPALESLMPSPSLPALPTLLAGAGALIAAGLASVALLGADAPAPEAPIVEAPVEAPADHTPTREPSWEIEEEQHVQALPSPDTPPHRPATTEDAYGVLGAPAGDLSSAEWFLGQGSLDDGRLSLLIFWESWCPHCDDALLDAEAKHRELAGRGLNVMGFTKLNKGVSVEEAYDHLDDMADGGVSFPNAHDVDSALTERFVVTGVPAAVLVQDGEVIWRDHPRRLDPALLDGLLAAP